MCVCVCVCVCVFVVCVCVYVCVNTRARNMLDFLLITGGAVGCVKPVMHNCVHCSHGLTVKTKH